MPAAHLNAAHWLEESAKWKRRSQAWHDRHARTSQPCRAQPSDWRARANELLLGISSLAVKSHAEQSSDWTTAALRLQARPQGRVGSSACPGPRWF